MTQRYVRAAALLLSLVLAPTLAAQTGKIAGRVTDAATGEALPGVNVRIDGTTQGTATGLDGYYTILNVRPGTLTIRASYIGYADNVVEDVRVNIGQTTTLDIAMREEALGIEGDVIVTATRPVVEVDVASSQANVTSEQIESLPISSVSSAVGLLAGAQGLSIRGSGSDELSFNVNGLTLRDERSNAPFTSIPLSSVQEVQVVTSGFNAEYGNVRSGVINVVTKEGDPTRFEIDASIRYSPPADKNFDGSANDPNSYWIRPYTDPAVAFTGTKSGAWDEDTRRQYPEFNGWIAASENLLKDNDPSNDMTPEALYQAFLWQHRKVMKINQPDYVADVGFGGPVPLLNRWGRTRFYASYREEQNMYLIPLNTDRFLQRSGHVKLTSDVARGMKLTVEGLYGNAKGTAASRTGGTGIFSSADGIACQMSTSCGSGVGFIDSRIFSTDYWAPTRSRDFMLGAKFSHALDDKSFYEIRFTRYASFYDTHPGPLRDTTKVVSFGGVSFDEGPFGFMPNPSTGVDGLRMGVGMSNARDTSRVVAYNVKADFTRQMNRFLEVKTGVEVNLSDSRVNYGAYDAFLPTNNFVAAWDKTPARSAAYLQAKLEFKGLVANPGLRLDYFNAGGKWYDYSLFDPSFANLARFDTIAQSPTKKLVTLSPRLGVSFPVTTFSKLYFNYGHFRQLPDPNNLFLVRYETATNAVTRVADPNAPLPKTIAYELGYEHSLFNQFLVRVAGYYKDLSLDPLLVTYNARSGNVSYSKSEPNSYADIRGFELSFARDRGRWVRGFVNYTYMVSTSGRFGLPTYYENTTTQREQEKSDALRRQAQSKPVPQPYGRINLVFTSPDAFGPAWGGVNPLGGVQLSLLGRWQAGRYFTWTGGGSIEGVVNNVQFKDYTNVEMRLSKEFTVGRRRVALYLDVDNLFNQRYLSFSGASDGGDYLDYMRSLHLPERANEYQNIPGKDRPGDYRKPGVAFVPIEIAAERGAVTAPRADRLYYERASQSYLEFKGGAWVAADQSKVDRVLKDKAYIDMPNQGFLTFLNPRDVYFGLRINL